MLLNVLLKVIFLNAYWSKPEAQKTANVISNKNNSKNNYFINMERSVNFMEPVCLQVQSSYVNVMDFYDQRQGVLFLQWGLHGERQVQLL